MDPNYWHKKWESNDIRFHQNHYHPWLVQNIKHFPKGKILIPLCGKTLDIIFFVQNGHVVVGSELNEIACESFFKENDIPFKIIEKENFKVFCSEKITLWCGDFFQLPEEAWQDVVAIYDRAALVALPNFLRIKYAQYIKSHAQKSDSFKIFLITFTYSSKEISGPPFSVSSEEVHLLYDELFDIQEIKSELNGPFIQSHPKFRAVDVSEHAYWGTKKHW